MHTAASEVARFDRAAARSFWAVVAAVSLPLVVVLGFVTGLSLPLAPMARLLHWCYSHLAVVFSPTTGAVSALLVTLPLLVVLASFLRRLRASRRFEQAASALALPWPTDVGQVLAELGLESRARLLPATVPDARTVGVWRPRVICTTALLELLTPAELAAVLRHELHHVHRRDPLRTLVVASIRSGFGWIPQVAGWINDFLAYREFAADASSLRSCSRRDLALALVKVMRGKDSVQLAVPGVSFAGRGQLRLAYVVEGTLPPLARFPHSVAVRAAILVALAWSLLLGSCGAGLH